MVMTETLVSVRSLKCHYSTGSKVVRAVDGVSLEIEATQTLGIVGESGSGKSTLALSMMGLLDAPGRIVDGAISFKGRDLSTLKEADWQEIRGKQIGMIFQSPEASFSPTATIGRQMTEVLQVHLGISTDEAKAVAKSMITQVGISRPHEILECYPFELSGGMCQRAALALSISLQPDLLLADEPTASLDLLAQSEITRLLISIRQQYRMAMVVISHDLGLIACLTDRVIIMYAGRAIESGPTAQVLGSPQHPYTQGLLASIPRLVAEPSDLQALTGSAPDMTIPMTGCSFLPRCSQSIERCGREQPSLVPTESGRHVACWVSNSTTSRRDRSESI